MNENKNQSEKGNSLLKYNVCHACQLSRLNNCAYFDKCESWGSYPRELRDMLEADYKNKIPLSITVEKAFDMGNKRKGKLHSMFGTELIINFIDWINNNWFVPTEDSYWKLDVENIEYQRTIPEKDSDIFYAEELFKMFLNGEGQS